jgi:hypothetical protein
LQALKPVRRRTREAFSFAIGFHNIIIKKGEHMDIRYAMHADHLKLLDTEGIRKALLVENLFENDKLTMVYSHIDRIIVGGACPVEQRVTPQVTKQLGGIFSCSVGRWGSSMWALRAR